MRPALLVLVAIVFLSLACTESPSEKHSTTPPPGEFKVAPNDPEFKKRVQAKLDEMKREEAVLEEAPWLGKTGLPDQDERELPRYLRREFGKLLSEPGSLKARDLEYLGVFIEGVETVHYWRINYGSPEPKFAYVVSTSNDHQVMDWGNRQPPQKNDLPTNSPSGTR